MTPSRRDLILALPLIAGIASGCAVGPQYKAPTPDVPEHWQQTAEGGLAEGKANPAEWWHVFDDETLTNLVREAAEGNLDLRMSVMRIRQARALRGIAVGELAPSLSGQGSYERSKASANGLLAGVAGPGRGEQFGQTVTRGITTGAVAEGLGAISPGMEAVASPLASGLVGLLPTRTKRPHPPETNLFATGFDASWEIDVFGGLRRNVQAADAGLDAAFEDYHDVLVSLLAEVAASYIDVRSLQAEIAATEQNIRLQNETLSLTQARLKYQLGSDLEVRQAETNLATTESQLPTLKAALTAAIYRLGVLLGKEPAALIDELVMPADIPQPAGETFVGVPADIIRRRPDIRAAERRLAAATASIGVAAADLYPRFTLSGTFGLQSASFNHALDRNSATYAFGPAFRWNIFDGLRNLNRIAAQEAVTHETYVAYEQTVLLALQEVETAMVNYKREQDRRDALLRGTQASRETVRLAKKRYEDGLTDFQDVVDAERSLVNLETALVRSQGQVAIDLVAVYKALGGGWSPDVVPQCEYLDAPSEPLDHPLRYFFTGGKNALPWEAPMPAAVNSDGESQPDQKAE